MMKLGKNMKHALDFIRKYNGWHTFTKDQPTVEAIAALQRRGLVEVHKSLPMFRMA